MALNKGNKGNQGQQQGAGNNRTAMGDAMDRAGYKANQQQPGAGPQGNMGGQQTPPPGYNAHAQPPGGGAASIMDINRELYRPVSRKSTGEVVLHYQDALTKSMERNFRQNAAKQFQLLVLDNNSGNVGPFSCLLVCLNMTKGGGEDYCAVYTLIVEASGGRLNNRTIPVGNGRNAEIETVAGDVYDQDLWIRIYDHVESVYGKKMQIDDAGSMVLPDELDPEDDEHIRKVLFNSTSACFTVMENNFGGSQNPFTVAWVNNNNDSLTARLDYNPGQSETATAEPVRSDVRITLQGTLNNNKANNNQNGIGFEQVRDLATVDGYVDLVYSPPQAQQAPQMYGQAPAMPTQHYYPRLVITRMDTEVDAITMELQLMALAQTTLLSRQMSWAGVFRQRREVKGTDPRDIGAIGYEVNLTGDPNSKPDRVDTKASDFDLNALYQLISMTIHDNLIYSMDVEEVGELSWIHQMFLLAAEEDGAAQQVIYNAANTLTMGEFAQEFKGNRVAYDDANRIHLGYYKDEKGKRRDLREIDYLALLNIAGKDDPSVVVKWGETFDNVDIPMAVRLEERANILRAILTDNFVIKGYARRISFDPEFLRALTMACARAGLAIRPHNLIHEFTGQGLRGNFNAGSLGLGGQQVSGLFNYGQPQWGNPQAGFGGGIRNRFGGRF